MAKEKEFSKTDYAEASALFASARKQVLNRTPETIAVNALAGTIAKLKASSTNASKGNLTKTVNALNKESAKTIGALKSEFEKTTEALKSEAKQAKEAVEDVKQKLTDQHRRANKAIVEYQQEVYKIIEDAELKKKMIAIPIPGV